MDCFTCGADRQAASPEFLPAGTPAMDFWLDSTIGGDCLTRSWKQKPEPVHRNGAIGGNPSPAAAFSV